MAKTRPEVDELVGQNIGFLFGTMMDLRMCPTELKHTGNVEVGEFKMVAHFPAVHEQNGTEKQYLAKHRTFRGGLYATYQDGPYKIDEIKWDATNKAGVHMVTKTKYGQIVEFPTQPSKSMPGSMKLMVQEYVESLKQPQLVIRCSGLGGALEPIQGKTDEYDLVLLNGDIKCPKKLHSHVPAKYHAEDDGRFNAQIGSWSFHAEEILSGSPGLQHHGLTRRRNITEVQDIEIVVNINWETDEMVDTKYQQDLQSWANNVIDYWMHDNREKIIDDEYGDWSDTWYSSDDGHDEDIEVSVTFNWELDQLNKGGSDYDGAGYWEYDAENFEASQRSGSDAGMGLCGGCRKQGQLMNFGRRKMCYDCAMERYGAEEFAAVSPYGPNLQREKKNIADAVSASYGSFKWSDCVWGPHFLRFSGEGSNKFYSVWVWERSPGVYTAMGAYGGLGQNPRLFNITQTADLQRAVNEAQKKMNQKQNKGYGVYN